LPQIVQPQVFAASGAVLLPFGQVVNNTLALQMPRQRLAPAAFRLWRSVSASRGKLFGSTGTVHLDYAQSGPFSK
jgi:hypothetical protein